MASVLALLCSMIAFSAAAIHAFTYALRRKEPAHFWLAVSALGIVGIAISTAMLYEAESVANAELWQRLMLSAAAPTLMGFGLAMSPVLFSYLGWNSSVYVASEIRNPASSAGMGARSCNALPMIATVNFRFEDVNHPSGSHHLSSPVTQNTRSGPCFQAFFT